eukprot:c3223_g1_i1.p1 GENE.c3223_g1_i1~~c3223_g1_i1.p1  ORF type:complete len:487 (+),score=86.76 c3223_g1_i1:85-1461(+)
MTPVWVHVMIVSLTAMGNVLCLIAGGVILRLRGIADNQTSKTLSKVFFNLFLPCLLMTRVGGTATLNDFWSWVVLAIAKITFTVIGLCIGTVLSSYFPPRFRNILRVALWNGNASGLPIVLCTSIANTAQGYNFSSSEAVKYIGLYSVMYQAVAWSLGPFMLRMPIEKPKVVDTGIEMADIDSVDSNTRLQPTASHSSWKTALKEVINPPVIGVLTGLLIAATPFLRTSLVAKSGAIHFAWAACETFGQAAVATSILVVGISLTGSFPNPKSSIHTIWRKLRSIHTWFLLKRNYATRNRSSVDMRALNLTSSSTILPAVGSQTSNSSGSTITLVIPKSKDLDLNATTSHEREHEDRGMGVIAIAIVCCTRLFVVPAFAYVMLRIVPLPHNAVHNNTLKLVIMVESMMPSANNMLIMCGAAIDDTTTLPHVARLLFWQLLLAQFTIAMWMSLFLYSLHA